MHFLKEKRSEMKLILPQDIENRVPIKIAETI